MEVCLGVVLIWAVGWTERDLGRRAWSNLKGTSLGINYLSLTRFDEDDSPQSGCDTQGFRTAFNPPCDYMAVSLYILYTPSLIVMTCN